MLNEGAWIMTYNPMELMICCAARLLENGRTVAVGAAAFTNSRSVATPPHQLASCKITGRNV